MSEWRLEMDQNVEKAIQSALIKYPHLSPFVEQRLEELLDFPPEKWFTVKFEEPYALFMPEHGQKVKFWGEAFMKSRIIHIIGFSIHD